MVKLQFTLSSLFVCLFVSSAYASECLYPKKLYSRNCKLLTHVGHNYASVEPAFIAYRLAVHGSTERKCRFSPTCSKFLIEAVRSIGPVKGAFFSFARAQMKHDNSFGMLPTFLNDGMLLVLDPVGNWMKE